MVSSTDYGSFQFNPCSTQVGLAWAFRFAERGPQRQSGMVLHAAFELLTGKGSQTLVKVKDHSCPSVAIADRNARGALIIELNSVAAEGGGKAGMASSAPSVLPAPSEKGSEEKQDAVMTNAADVPARYDSEAYRDHEDAIQNFKRVCEEKKVDYADAFLAGNMTAQEYKKVDNARRYLNQFWKAVRKLYIAGKLADEPGDFFSKSKRWLRTGNNYRVLVEPLDIANWYKCGNHTSGSGHYIDTVPQGEEGMRPSQYAFLDRLMREAGGEHKHSLRKAEEYKNPAFYGGLHIQTIGDARANPPRGFLLPPTVDVSGAGSKTGSNETEPPSPTGVLEQLALTPKTPDVAGRSSKGGTVPSNSTPDTQLTAEEIAKLSQDPKVPPYWGKGVPLTYRARVGVIPGHELPAPIDEDGRPIHPGKTWDPPGKTEEIQVKYETLVYKAEDQKYLVVRVNVTSSGKMVHDIDEHEGRYAGYYQESLRVAVIPLIDDAASKDTVLYLEKKGLYPENVVPLPLAVTNTTTKTSTWKADVNIGGTVDAVKGPALVFGFTPGYSQSTANAQQVGGQQRPFQRSPVSIQDRSLVWDRKLELCFDGIPYPPKGAKRMPKMPDYATGHDHLEVQATWSFPGSLECNLKVRIEIQQVLAYAAMWPKLLKYNFKVYRDREGQGKFSDDIALDKFEKTSKDLQLPFGRS